MVFKYSKSEHTGRCKFNPLMGKFAQKTLTLIRVLRVLKYLLNSDLKSTPLNSGVNKLPVRYKRKIH